MDEFIELQKLEVAKAEEALEAERQKQQDVMEERKIHEKLREKAFEAFMITISVVTRNTETPPPSTSNCSSCKASSFALRFASFFCSFCSAFSFFFSSILCLLIKLDVGGFGSGVLAPAFKDVPVINKILPEAL